VVWFKVDDSLPDHPKTLAMQGHKSWKGAVALWTLAGAWCGKHLTDGEVPRGVVQRLGCSISEAELLVSHGFWEVTPTGFRFHDWEARNPTRESVESQREKTRKRVAKHESKERANDTPNAVPNAATNAVSNAVRNASPVPTRPDPSRPDHSQQNRDVCEGGASHPPVALVPRLVKPRSKASTAPAWDAYCMAYAQRYRREPTRNAKVNGQLSQFCQRIPAADWGLTIEHYVRSPNARYVAAGHTLGPLLQDAEKLHTEALTGQMGTAAGARRVDHKADRLEQYDELFAELRAEDEADRLAGGGVA